MLVVTGLGLIDFSALDPALVARAAPPPDQSGWHSRRNVEPLPTPTRQPQTSSQVHRGTVPQLQRAPRAQLGELDPEQLQLAAKDVEQAIGKVRFSGCLA